MVLNTVEVNNNKALIGMVGAMDSFLHIDSEEKALYVSGSNIALKLNVALELDEKEETGSYVFSKKEFFHVTGSCPSIHINKDYSYNTGSFKGTFQTLESEKEVLIGIKEMFGEENYEKMFEAGDSLKSELEKALYFVSKDDINPASRGIHISTNAISASSMFRIYTNKQEMGVSCFLPYSLIKTLLETKETLTVYKSEQTYKLQNDKITIIFAGNSGVSPLPVEEDKFKSSVEALKNSTKVTFNTKSIIEKLSFLSFYAERKKNGATKLSLDKDSKLCYFQVDDNVVEIPIEEDLNENVEFY